MAYTVDSQCQNIKIIMFHPENFSHVILKSFKNIINYQTLVADM